MRAKVFNRVETRRRVKQREFAARCEFDCRAASRRHILDAPDGDEATLALRSVRVRGLRAYLCG